ncbi:Zn(II)2Cys6 transcription factor domain-containing protein [Sporobolomyces salmoneus]|uniref:Zn(II)2Cys6 transcription factor domain-containing protein n=1 Tax=Sporobolomyces salmoneus TaxID=183962 RepID=UPI0031824A6D
MGASSERRGRKIRREGGHRTPACKACQQRKVKCSGGSPCSACCRKAAWDGVPPPEFCEYDGGFIPARKPAPPSNSRQPAGSPDGSEGTDGKGKGKASKPLQKGLACLACKSRRVRCDGSKPACGSCLRTAKRENRDPCCVYRADLHVAQQQLQEARPPPPTNHQETERFEEPHTSPRSCSSSSSHGSASPQLQPTLDFPMRIPESALPPLPVVAVVDSPRSSVFPPPVPSRTSSTSTSFSYSHPPSPSLTHTSTDPSSSSFPSPATPYSTVEDFLPPDHLDNYPPLPYPPSHHDSIWAVPHLALGAAAVSSSSSNLHPLQPAPTCESVEFQTATHDLDLTLTLPMSPPATFKNLATTPVKVEQGESAAGIWWT